MGSILVLRGSFLSSLCDQSLQFVQACWMYRNQSSKSQKYPDASGHQVKKLENTFGSREMLKDRNLNWNTCPWKGNLKKHQCYGATGTWKYCRCCLS